MGRTAGDAWMNSCLRQGSCWGKPRATRPRRSSTQWPKPRRERLTIEPSEGGGGDWKAEPLSAFGPVAAARALDTLPPENIAAIQLLDTWLDQGVQEPTEEWEQIKRTIDDNRLSDRKLFS